MAIKKKSVVRDVGEWGLIEWVKRHMPLNASGLIKGVGDDAALLIGGEIITTDMLVEKVHFDRKWQDLTKLGRKALCVNLSDIAAMGGFARCAFLSVAFPGRMKWSDAEAILTGFSHAAREYGVAVAGGNTTSSPNQMVISVTVVGNAPRPVLRNGARPGDRIFVTGTLGDAALALRLVNKGNPGAGANIKFLLDRLTDPTPRMVLGRTIAQYASSMIDVSDGLAGDLGHILKESSVGAKIQMKNIPLSEAYRFVKGRLKERDEKKLYADAIRGGDDYELIFTVPNPLRENIYRIADGAPITEIGEIVPESEGSFIIGRDGNNIPLKPEQSFRHF